MTRALLVVVALAGCAKEKKEQAPPSPKPQPTAQADATPAAVVAAPDATKAFALGADCLPDLRGLYGEASQAQNAMSPQRPMEKAIALWQGMRAECRGAMWYRGAAILIRAGATTPLEADGVSIDGVHAALDGGLAAEPGDLELLGYVAYLSGIDAALSPALPADACDRANATPAPAGTKADIREHDELVAYVCGHAALAAQQFADAATKLTAITDPTYPDVGVRIVQAHRGAGDAKAAKAAMKAADATIERYGTRLGASPRDADVLRALLK